MTAEPAFTLHPLAAQDITEIWEYIAADNPLAARRVREEIYGAIRAIVQFPYRGHPRPDLTSRPLRFIRVRDYLIAYAPDEDKWDGTEAVPPKQWSPRRCTPYQSEPVDRLEPITPTG